MSPRTEPTGTGGLTRPATPPVAESSSPSATPTGDDTARLLGPEAQRPWWRRWGLWLGVLALLAAVGGAYAWRQGQVRAATPVYSTEAVTRGDLTLTVVANGTLQPTRSVNVGSELSGAVRRVLVDVNDVVRRGQVMIELDPAKLRDQVLRSQATLAASQGKVAQMAATVQEAQAALARLEAVAVSSGGEVPSRAELDAGRATLARALADEGSARAGVQDATAALSTDRINLAKASILAPTDGVVLSRTVEPGNAVAASLQAVTLLTLGEDLRHLRLWVYVDEADVGSVRLGQSATFTVSAYLGRAFPARITRVGQGPTLTDNVVTYLTYLDVDNADLSLRPGMTATASIIARQLHQVLRVPNTALRFEPSDSTAAVAAKSAGPSLLPRLPSSRTRQSAASGASTALARQVWVIQPDAPHTPVAVAVTPGLSDGHFTEITQGELREGMRVVVDQKKAGSP
ncbi:efflux RND transporter periplasmic adaptor subunit [Curvibacter sp. HBC28]|uniref:Efflux RND transporter periplasmic adaptor subunit n=1 Tax=Curvibacter microcysteis TaxID=3026419 RepID=A0ABT5MHE0_9BURK|nr:efflux RND transporter periplasmic adaptor subunit [Curvibacter sp. HBC28]MDD0815992.1 efflux RND transporter periplasmic adaptor subunit [Curvibacter sp. HBC28]